MASNPNSILFLYEGETESEFYKTFFENLPQREVKISRSNLKGVYGLNDKVRSKIKSYLRNKAYDSCKQIHVFIAYDRDGDRDSVLALDIDSLQKEFVSVKQSRISSINQVVATQDLESWFFHDLLGIYKFLRVSVSKRNMKAFPNVEATNNYILSDFFHKNGKHYQKGRRVEGFLNSLDMELIFSKVEELEEFKQKLIELMNPH